MLKKIKMLWLGMIKYRSEHSYFECIDKYGEYEPNIMDFYIHDCNILEEYENVKDLDFDDPRQIKFMKKYGDYGTGKYCGIYIEGKGYGSFLNPYSLWDYYTIVDEIRFPRGTNFLVSKDGNFSNNMSLRSLDVESTLVNIEEHTQVFESIIFCECNPFDSKLFTIDNIRFNYDYNKHCLVDDLKDVLLDIQKNYSDDFYIVSAVDFHWWCFFIFFFFF